MSKPKGSTVIIACMYLTWVAYLALGIWVQFKTGMWLPSEITYCTAGLFITETASLAALKMRKEGQKAPQKNNEYLGRHGVITSGSFDDLEVNDG